MITQGFGAGSGGIHGNNNIAVASLISTANSVGMTLEQFAMSLSNSPTLFQVLSSNPDPTEKLTLAVSLYRTDARAQTRPRAPTRHAAKEDAPGPPPTDAARAGSRSPADAAHRGLLPFRGCRRAVNSPWVSRRSQAFGTSPGSFP